MNTRFTVVVLIGAIALGLFAYFNFRKKSKTPTTPTPAATSAEKPLLDLAWFKPDAIDEIDLSYPNGDHYHFIQTKNRSGQTVWMQTEPIPYRMENWSINLLGSAVTEITYNRIIEPKELTGDLSLTHLGLNPPAATLTLTSDSFGSHNPITLNISPTILAGNAHLQMEADGPVYVTNDSLQKRLLSVDPTEWRNKTIFDNLAGNVSRIEIENSDTGDHLKLWKTGTQWRIIEPVRTHADSNAIAQLITNFTDAKLRGFAKDNPDNLTLYGLNQPSFQISLETDQPKTDGTIITEKQSLLIGHPIDLSEDQTRYAMRGERNDVFTLTAYTVDRLTTELTALASKQVLNIGPENIKSAIIYDHDGYTTHIERHIEGWSVTQNDGSTAQGNAQAIDSLLTRLILPHENIEIGSIESIPDAAIAARVEVRNFDDQQIGSIIIATINTKDQPLIIYDDASGLLRSTPIQPLPPLSPDQLATDDYIPPAVPAQEIQETPTEPVK